MLGSCVRHSLAAYPRVVTTHQLTHCTVAQRLGLGLRPGRGPHPGGGAGKLPAGRWQRGGTRSAAPLHGRHCGAGALNFLLESQASTRMQERWQSGRMYLTRNQA